MFPAAEIFLVNPIHASSEEMACVLSGQRNPSLFVVMLVYFLSLHCNLPKSNLSLCNNKKTLKQTVNRPNLTYILINYTLHQFVKIKLKPPTVGLSLSYIEQRLYMYKGKKTKKNILKKLNNLFIYSILCKTWMPNIRCYDVSSALL